MEGLKYDTILWPQKWRLSVITKTTRFFISPFLPVLSLSFSVKETRELSRGKVKLQLIDSRPV